MNKSTSIWGINNVPFEYEKEIKDETGRFKERPKGQKKKCRTKGENVNTFLRANQKILIQLRFRFPLTLCLIRDINQVVTGICKFFRTRKSCFVYPRQMGEEFFRLLRCRLQILPSRQAWAIAFFGGCFVSLANEWMEKRGAWVHEDTLCFHVG